MSGIDLSNIENAASELLALSDEDLRQLKFTMPWETLEDSQASEDYDGFIGTGIGLRNKLQEACWEKFNKNPQVSTAVRGHVGRLTGMGFEASSEVPKIQDIIDEVEFDPRNRLYTHWPKFVGRSIIEGELYLCLTLHNDGFVEVDFIDPGDIQGGGEDGIIYHPHKSTMPLFYFIKQTNAETGSNGTALVPSIYIARYPELLKVAQGLTSFKGAISTLRSSMANGSKYKKIGGFKRFIVSWDKSFMTKRNVSHLRTILEWLNHYETLKKYEIDHKKSAGSYLWVVTMTDVKTFRSWLALSDDERRKTGIMAKKTPGGTLIMPPGMTLTVQNPSLPTISESDTDIFHMITAGLNEPEDVTSGQSKGTFSSVKASRGPMTDRISDEIAYFERFLRHDFWGSIFFLKTMIAGFPAVFDQRVAIDFKNQEPVFRNVKRRPEFLMEITFPTSEVTDAESRAKALLGVKHGDVHSVLGIPHEQIAKKLGFGNYRKLRLQHATEAERFPELAVAVDQASIEGQDVNSSEKGDSGTADKAKKEDKGQKNPDAKPVVKPKINRRKKE